MPLQSHVREVLIQSVARIPFLMARTLFRLLGFPFARITVCYDSRLQGLLFGRILVWEDSRLLRFLSVCYDFRLMGFLVARIPQDSRLLKCFYVC